ncbi:MAG: bifunctional glutamate N-acetyltransferase/amino-acid acetyltransferase ArgJ [Clostridiales bacterium]|nr:bifunctional glutamate N-acetyltransferase/amino-acid acetyltransferase ArgJ [Clostridiales bacterium]
MQYIAGGVCAPKGFKAAGVHCGIRRNRSKYDLALIVSDEMASAAAVYTQNLVKGAPILVTQKHLENGYARAVIVNSGNANTCNANGIEIAEGMCALVREYTGIREEDVAVASTGVIGQPLSLQPISDGMQSLVDALSPDGSVDAANAIMTTDTLLKQFAVEFEVDGVLCSIGGIAKGSGMIHPNMATMLAFLTTDCAISPEMLREALLEDVQDSFNMVSVDGDTSTNDMALILANGLAGNTPIEKKNADYAAFRAGLRAVTQMLARAIAKDGEGATKLIVSKVVGAKDKQTARTVAKSVICSNLFKAAMFGADANWGRVLCAIGYSGADVDVNKIDVSFSSEAGSVAVCSNGAGIPFSEEMASKVLAPNEIRVLIDLCDGEEEATAWGCDLTYDYVKINGDYRT